MIKLFNRYLPSKLFMFIAVDAMCILALTTIALSFALGNDAAHSAKLLLLVSGASAIWIGAFYFCDLYDLDATRKTADVLSQSIRAVGMGAIVIAPIAWFFLPSTARSGYLEAALLLSFFVLCAYRLGFTWISSHLFSGERVLLVGSGPVIQALAHRISVYSCLPLKLVAVVPEDENSRYENRTFHTCGSIADLDSITASFRPHRIAIDLAPRREPIPASQLIRLRQKGIRIEDASSLYEAMTGSVPIEFLDARRLAFGKGLSLSPLSAAAHRVTDIVLSSLGLLVMWPVFIAIAVALKLDSPGSIIYAQERVGLNGKVFRTLKFRSMRVDAETLSGPVWASERDPRITRVGRILRKVRLDELPQLWNVLRGDMSMVGPRPERPHFVDLLREHIPFYELRHSVRPGITGWAQVCATYGSSIEESQVKVEYDLFYLKNISFAFDAFILFKTAKICIFGRGSR